MSNSKRKANKAAASAAIDADEVERRIAEWKALPPIRLGEFEVPKFDGPSIVFGADLRQFPAMDTIPAEFRQYSGKFQDIVSSLFFEDHPTAVLHVTCPECLPHCEPFGTPISQVSGRPGEPGYAKFVSIANSWGYP